MVVYEAQRTHLATHAPTHRAHEAQTLSEWVTGASEFVTGASEFVTGTSEFVTGTSEFVTGARAGLRPYPHTTYHSTTDRESSTAHPASTHALASP